MEANGVNYYKGVLLCSRPNESPSIQKEKPFCGRVTPYDAIGLVPTHKFDKPQTRKRHLPVLNNHKKWLKSFKEKVDKQKQQVEEQKEKQVRRLQKIKQDGARRLRELKNSESTSMNPLQAANVQSSDANNNYNKSAAVNQSTRMKKGKKPVWAKTDEQIQQEQEKQVDDLIDFFDTAQVADYLDDQEVKKMVEDLKKRINIMKDSGDRQNGENNAGWKKKQAERIQQAKLKIKADKEQNDDIISRISRQSGTQSVTSQKTAQRVQELNKKKQQKQWDKYTTSQKRNQANLDDQIAKNVADQVLRNYPALKHHSNQSIRQMLVKQAHQQIQS